MTYPLASTPGMPYTRVVVLTGPRTCSASTDTSSPRSRLKSRRFRRQPLPSCACFQIVVVNGFELANIVAGSRIEREHANASRDLPVLGRLTMLSSARNQLAGRVVEIQTGAVNDQISLELSGGGRVIATITRESTKLLQLKRGTPLTALIKAPWIMLAAVTATPLACSAANRLEGVIRRIKRGAVSAEVVLELPGGQTLAAVVTEDSIEALGLRRGQPAIALFNASSVILVRLD